MSTKNTKKCTRRKNSTLFVCLPIFIAYTKKGVFNVPVNLDIKIVVQENVCKEEFQNPSTPNGFFLKCNNEQKQFKLILKRNQMLYKNLYFGLVTIQQIYN